MLAKPTTSGLLAGRVRLGIPNIGQPFLLAAVLVVPLARVGELPAAPGPVLCQTNLVLTVMAANLTGQSQRYEEPQIRILQGLKPDVVALQEFRYGNSSPPEIRAFVDLAFGTNYSYYRESSATETYGIPNGIVSRFPIADSGCWDDVTIPDRGFAWARLRLPGTNDLYVISVHFKASSGSANSAQRATEAANLRDLVEAHFPPDAWVVVAGDLNTGWRGEQALTTLTGFLSDAPIPTDAISGGNEKTNLDRDRPYDYVLPSFSMTNSLAPVVLGGQSFSNGLIFDSRVFAPLPAVPPIQRGDSTNGQHMAVLKAFHLCWTLTNWIELPCPQLRLVSDRQIEWDSPSNLVFRVQANARLTDTNDWHTVATATSTTTRYSFAPAGRAGSPMFYRVTTP
jgi:endonuclease/exonuclease/phosphatase family metal-dependent hydrolase